MLLRLFPLSFREEYATAMEETFVARMADARRQGRRATLRLWLRESLGLLNSAVRERGGQTRQAGEPGQPRGARARDSLRRELRHALRRLLRSPGFTAAALLSLGLALGANTAIFTLVRRIVLRPLPWPQSNQLLALEQGAPGLNIPTGLGLTEALYEHFLQRTHTLESIAMYWSQSYPVQAGGEPERLRITTATPTLLRVLRSQPQLGRWFQSSEGTPGSPAVVVLSHGLWQRRFAGRTDVLGQSILVNGMPHEVVGVMSASFAFPDPATDLWIPAVYDTANPRVGGFNWVGVARMKPGMTVADVRTDVDRAIATFAGAHPGNPTAIAITRDAHMHSTAIPLKQQITGSIERTLWLLLGSVAIVLLVACGNVANLFLVRAEARSREVAVRRALGAGRRGIALHFLAESALLSLGAWLLGMGVAQLAVKLLVRHGPAGLPRLHEVHLDLVIFVFAALLALACTVVFATAALMRVASGRAESASLREAGRANTTSRQRMRLRHFLIAGQMALAALLLVACGLMAKSFLQIRHQDPGFDANSALVFEVGLPEHDYPARDRDREALLHHTLLEHLRSLPGVRSAAAATCLPLDGFCWGDPMKVDGVVLRQGEIPPVIAMRRVTAGYFSAMGTRVLRGRAFESGDEDHATRAVVINQALANLYFAGRDPIGQRIFPDIGATSPAWFTVVGVVGNTATTTLTESQPVGILYFPLRDGSNEGPSITSMGYVVRTAVPPLSLVDAVQHELQAIDARVPLARVRTLEDSLGEARAQAAFTLALLAIAASVALLLGLVGVYGVISYAVSQRRSEIGVRLALGARPGDVSRMIVRQGTAVVLSGLFIGLAASVATSRLMNALLFRVSAHDPVTYLRVSAILFAVALLACWLPARRAARLDPATALRAE